MDGMADNPFTKRLTQVGQNRLETYTEQILDFVEKLEAQTPDPFIPMLTDLALAHVLITHLVRQFGPARGMQESRIAFEDTYEKMKPIMERLEAERGEGGTPYEALRKKPPRIGYGNGHIVHRRMQT
jgi:hypothetical protein